MGAAEERGRGRAVGADLTTVEGGAETRRSREGCSEASSSSTFFPIEENVNE